MPKDELIFKELLNVIPQVGKVEWIGIRTARKVTPTAVDTVSVTKSGGLDGDHFSGTFSKKRQVTLIQKEHLDVVAAILGKTTIDPGMTRRNIVVSGINLLALKNQHFKIGTVILETTGPCHPCNRMEHNLGEGGYNAMRGHGGITAKVVEDGEINIGDQVSLV